MSIRVEFYGIPRQRAGVEETSVATDGEPIALASILQELADRFPDFATTCCDEGTLRPGFVANVGGQRFLSDVAGELQPGDSVLIMSADAGG